MQPPKNHTHLIIAIIIVLVFIGLGIFGYRWYLNSSYRVVNVANPTATLPKVSPIIMKLPATSISNTNYLLQYEKTILTSSVVTNTFVGKIAATAIGENGTVKYYQFGKTVAYVTSITLEDANGNKNNFYYSTSDVAVLKVLRANGGAGVLSELKVGDSVQIVESVDMLKPPGQNRISVSITQK